MYVTQPVVSTAEEFEKMCKQHDWYYDKSDDMRVWDRGYASEQTLRQAIVTNRQFMNIFEKYKPTYK